MSIETLLEAAKFLELQAQQQQKTREENELRERLRQEQEAEQRKRTEAAAAQAVRVNNHHHHHHHVTWVEEPSGPERRLAPLPPQLQPPPPSLPIAVIPIPVVPSAPNPQTAFLPAPNTARSPPTVHHQQQQGSPRKDARSPPTNQHGHPLHVLISPQPESEPASLTHSLSAANKHQHQHQPHLVQSYPGTIVSASQHAMPPQLGSPQQAQASPVSRGSPPDDGRHGDGKKRPGGAGTREVHNKLEKNRRAHLKECFETLKKNIPNVDEKKASNLSVLRSALRYIQTLKRKEKEFEHEMERLAREKIATQQRLAELKNELSQWMDVLEIDRLLRQTVQPEDDQASTSTASEGEDNIDDDDDDIEEQSPSASPTLKVPQAPQPEPRKASPVPARAALLTTNNHHHHHHHNHHSPTTVQHKLPPQLALSAAALTAPAKAQALVPVSVSAAVPTTIPSPVAALSPVTSSPLQAQTLMAPQALLAAHAHIVAAPGASNGMGALNNGMAGLVQPTVIAHAAPVSHASVIQATVNHIIQPAGKHAPQVLQQQPGHHAHPGAQQHATLAHLAPSPATLAHLAPSPGATPQPIGHITVHPVAHLSQHHLPTLYPQTVAVTQPAMVSHIAHTLSHAQVNGASPGQMGKPAGAQVVAHHPQLVGQTVLNPVTMVTMPSFPVSTLKLA
ncbi:max-binding protein MNT isoform X2 [Sardina pilchardus]|uniref:max-binding protein MNT isoform X2 n=1 Tax=Sardina pilchardus TaxID=27697 RepID=UPI002E0F23B6